MNLTILLLSNASKLQPPERELSNTYKTLDLLAAIIEIYINKAILGFGILFNAFLVIVILNKNLTHTIYNYLWCHLFCNVAECVLGIASWQFPKITDNHEKYKLAFLVYQPPSLRITIWAATLSKILLIANRHFTIIKKQSFLCNLSKKANLLISFGISIAVGLPMYFSLKIVGPEADGMYHLNTSEWGQSLYFKTYNLGTVLLDSVVPLTAHLFFSISSVKRFHKIMLRKANLQNFQQRNTDGVLLQTEIKRRHKINNADIKFNNCITLLCVISLIVHTTDTLSSILDRIGQMGILHYTPELTVLSTLFKQAAFTILYSLESGEGFIYMKMDSNLRNVVLKVFQLKKVTKCDYCTGIIITSVFSPSIY